MRKTIKIRKLNNKGSALVTTMVVAVVVTAFVLSLILVAYSLFSNVMDKGYDFEARELAESAIAELDRELVSKYSTYEDLNDAARAGENPYYMYVRFNMGSSNWTYYEKTVPAHFLNAENVCKYFTMDFMTKEDNPSYAIPGMVKVTMYWERDASAASTATEPEDIEKGTAGAILHVKVDAEYKNAVYSVSRVYSLDIISVDGIDEALGDKNVIISGGFNPEGKSISSDRMWIWTKLSE